MTGSCACHQPADPMAPVPHQVVAVRHQTDDVVTLDLAPVGDALSALAAGQFVMAWAPGAGEIPISVSGRGEGGAIELTVRSVGLVSAAITGCGEGDVIGLRGPYGTAWPVAAAAGRDTVVVAGGLGLAPLRIAIDQLVAALSAGGAGSPSRLTVVIGARDPSQLTFLADIERWQSSGAHVHTTVDHPDDTWTGSVGNTTVVLEQMGEARGLALVCGPEPMMTSAAHTLVRLGTPPDTVHLSLERNMHFGIAHCGRCQLGPLLLCRDGAVVGWNQVAHLLEVHGR